MTRLPLSYLPALLIALAALVPVVVLFALAEAPDGLFESRNLRLLANTLLLTAFTALGAVQLSDGPYPVLALGPEAKPFLKGERPVQLPQPARAATGGQTAARAAKAAYQQDPLFQSLRQLRLKLAREHDVPPYVIFNDATLHALVEQSPMTLAEFAEIPGVGQRKLDQWGAVFVDAIRDHHDR